MNLDWNLTVSILLIMILVADLTNILTAGVPGSVICNLR